MSEMEMSSVVVPIDSVNVSEAFNPRTSFDREKLEELKGSIKQDGLLQPIVVRHDGTDKLGKQHFFLIAGSRRLRAKRELGDKTIEVKIVQPTHEASSIQALVENLQREDMHPLDEARAIKRYMDKFTATQGDIAKRLSKSPSWVSQRLKLLELAAPDIQEAVDAGELTVTAAQALTDLPPEAQTEVLEEIRERTDAREGKAPAAAEVKNMVSRKKADLKPEGSYVMDQEDVIADTLSELQEEYADLEPRSKDELLEGLAKLLARLENTRTDRTLIEIKAMISAFEWMMESRDNLI